MNHNVKKWIDRAQAAAEADMECTKQFGEPSTAKIKTDGVKFNVRDIVKEWLQCHGYDGLSSAGGGCYCEIDDLAPCGDIGLWCEPMRIKTDDTPGNDN